MDTIQEHSRVLFFWLSHCAKDWTRGLQPEATKALSLPDCFNAVLKSRGLRKEAWSEIQKNNSLLVYRIVRESNWPEGTNR